MKKLLIIIPVALLMSVLLILGVGYYSIQSRVKIASDKDLSNLPGGTREMVLLLQDKINENNVFEQPFLDGQKLSAMKFAIDNLLWITPELRKEWMKEYAYTLLEAGRTRESIDQMQAYIKKAGISMDTVSESNIEYQKFMAIAYLRVGEQENCLLNHNSKSCIIPFAKEAVHIKKEGALNAAKLYTKILQTYPHDLASRWLLNIAYQALGQPDSVPENLIIPLRDDYTGRVPGFPHFENIAGKLGIDASGVAGGVIADDFNNDGLLDLVVSSHGSTDQLRYFENRGKDGFVDRTEEAGLTGLVGGFNLVQTDYNNDGLLDIFVLRGAWDGTHGRFPKSLLKNLGNGKFEDVTKKAGLLSFYPSQVACWGDFNNDGWLDVFIGNELLDASKLADSIAKAYPSELYLNNGDGTFTNVARKLNMEIYEHVKGATWTDYNNDGLPDLLVSIKGRPNKLFRNEGGKNMDDWKFTDVSAEAGIGAPVASFPCWSFDYNNDGWEDLFIADYNLDDSVAGNFAAEALGLPPKAGLERPGLYKNNGDGTFSHYTDSLHLNKLLYAMGSNYGDLDNDGFLDFYIGTGSLSYEALMPNRMFRNFEGKYFEEVTYSGGFGLIQKGHGVSFADLDNDGDQDVYIVMGGAVEGDYFHNAFFENPGNGNSWITIKLQGVKSNRPAIGAKLKLVAVNASGQEQTIYRVISSGGSFGANPLQAQIGLGKAIKIKQLSISWPNALHTVQHFENIPVNQFISIQEGSNEIKTERRTKLNFAEISGKTIKCSRCQPQ